MPIQGVVRQPRLRMPPVHVWHHVAAGEAGVQAVKFRCKARVVLEGLQSHKLPLDGGSLFGLRTTARKQFELRETAGHGGT